MAGRPSLPKALSYSPKSAKEIVQETTNLLDELYRRNGELGAEPPWTDLFVRLARWTHIAPFNLLLADVQRPGAKFVAFQEQWDRVGREPIPRAVPIILLWPFCPVRCAYSQDQTDGKEPSFEHLLDLFGKRLERNSKFPEKLAKRIWREDEIKVEFFSLTRT